MASKKTMTEIELDAEEIRARVERYRHRLRFALFLAAIAATGYVLGEEIKSPPVPDPSIECAKIPGTWHSETYDARGDHIHGFCDRK